MKVVVRIGGHERDLDVVLRNPEATVGQLLEAVTGRRSGGNVAVGERAVPASTPLLHAGVHAGTVVSPDSTAPSASLTPGLQLVVTGGLDAGLRVPLGRAATTVGRSSAADVVLASRTLSPRHVTFLRGEDGALRVRDEGSTNGTSLDGRAVPGDGLPVGGPGVVVLAGAVALSVRDEQPTDRHRGVDLVRPTGTLPFDRPPRARTPPPPAPVALPVRRGASAEVRVNVVLLLAPLLLAGVAVAITGDARFALLGALGPVLGLGTYLEQRRRAARADRDVERDLAAALATLQAHLDAGATVERDRLRDLCPDPAEMLRRAALPTARLWERRPAGPGFLTLHAGVADLAWTPPVRSEPSEQAPEVAEALARPRLLSAPVQVDLADGGVVGVVGERAAALAVARSLLCQAVVQSGPADLTVGVLVDEGREAAWEWAKWLPHTHRAGADGDDRWLAAGRERSDVLLRALAGRSETPALLLVLDSDVLVEGEGESAPARALLGAGRRSTSQGQDRGPLVAGIVLAASEDRLPPTCRTVVVVGEEGDAVVRHPEEQVEVRPVLAAGLSVARARDCARDLARFDDPELAVVRAGLTDGVRLLPLLDLQRVDADSVRRRWQSPAGAKGLTAPVGVTETGVLTLDLVRDGPHGLVVGTTGSGASAFLCSLVAALAARHDPTRLTFVLVDLTGGATFDVCARLPHTVGTLTDVDSPRALRTLEAELDHRERLFAGAGVGDHAAYVATRPAAPLPRLVLVVDELAVLAEDVLAVLVSIGARGRALGVHLVLATERTAGAVRGDILMHTRLRVALRVQSAQDPGGVVDEPDAPAASRGRAGRAYVRVGHDEVIPAWTALATCVTSEQADAPVEVRPFPFGPAGATEQAALGGARTDLERLVDAIVQAAADAGIPPPRRP